MDLSTVLTSGVISAVMGFSGALLGLRIAVPRVKALMLDEIDAYVTALPERLAASPQLMEGLMNIVANSLVGLMKNPKFVQDLTGPLLASLGAGGPAGAEPTVKLPVIGKVPLSMILGLLGKGAKPAAEAAAGGLLGMP